MDTVGHQGSQPSAGGGAMGRGFRTREFSGNRSPGLASSGLGEREVEGWKLHLPGGSVTHLGQDGDEGGAPREGRGQNSTTSPAPPASAMQAPGCPPAGRRSERDWPDPRCRVAGRCPSLEQSCRREVRWSLKGFGQALRVEISRRVRSAA